MKKRTINLAAIRGAIASPKTPQRLKNGLIKKYGVQLGIDSTGRPSGLAPSKAPKFKSKNPGAAWHKEMMNRYDKIKGDMTSDIGRYAAGSAGAHYLSMKASKRLGINPLAKWETPAMHKRVKRCVKKLAKRKGIKSPYGICKASVGGFTKHNPFLLDTAAVAAGITIGEIGKKLINKNPKAKFSLGKFAQMIGKTSDKMNKYDMMQYMNWLEQGMPKKFKYYKSFSEIGDDALRKMGLKKNNPDKPIQSWKNYAVRSTRDSAKLLAQELANKYNIQTRVMERFPKGWSIMVPGTFKIKENPGAAWHEEKAKIHEKLSDDYYDKGNRKLSDRNYDRMIVHEDSVKESKKLGINPAGWSKTKHAFISKVEARDIGQKLADHYGLQVKAQKDSHTGKWHLYVKKSLMKTNTSEFPPSIDVYQVEYRYGQWYVYKNYRPIPSGKVFKTKQEAERYVQKLKKSHMKTNPTKRTWPTYQVGKQTWRISIEKGKIFLYNMTTGFSEWPIIYHTGEVGYDRPEKIPASVKKWLWSIVQKNKHLWPKDNPPKKMTKIYDDILAIEAVKGKDSLWPKEKFRHDFKKSKGKAAIYGMPDGTLMIKGPKELWKNFDYSKEDV